MKLVNSLMSSLSSCASACSGAHLGVGGRIGWISSTSCSGVVPSCSGDRDRVDLPFAVEELLRRRQVEDGERRGADRVDVAELGDSRTSKSCLGWSVGDLDRVADLVVLLVGGAGVDRRPRRGPRPAPSTSLSGLKREPPGRVDAEAEAGRAARVDGLAVVADDLGVRLVGDAAARRPRRPASVAHLVDERLVDGGRLASTSLGSRCRRLPDHDASVPGVGLVEDGRERLVDRVRQDVACR